MISNEEISNRFDVLYNNIMSDQAPGLDDYEKSVFFNKAQLEVLKNHLNAGGNRYQQGFDHSSKRQMDFSTLTVQKTFSLFPQRTEGVVSGTWRACVVETVQQDANSAPVYEVVDAKIDYNQML